MDKPFFTPNRFESNKKGSSNPSIDSITNKLVDKFEDPNGRGFYMKVAREKTEAEIDRAVELSFKYGKKPAAYFNRCISSK